MRRLHLSWEKESSGKINYKTESQTPPWIPDCVGQVGQVDCAIRGQELPDQHGSVVDH